MIFIDFNKKIYSIEAINLAIKSYKSLAKFTVKNNKNYCRVVLNDIDDEIKNIIGDEFSNYVFYMTRNIKQN